MSRVQVFAGVRVVISCRNPVGFGYNANVWSAARCNHGGPAQLGHGAGATRAEAIRAAKDNFHDNREKHLHGRCPVPLPRLVLKGVTVVCPFCQLASVPAETAVSS